MPISALCARQLQVLGTSLIMGLFFGTFFQKTHVYEPYVIRGQFVFTSW